jgi:hypothetical protein
MADGVSTRNADESQRLSTQRAQRTQSFRNESRPFRRLRGNESVERIDFPRESEETRGGSDPPQCKIKTLLEVKDIHDDFRVAIPQHDVPANGDAFAIGRRRGKPAVQVDGNKDNAAFQAWRKHAAKHKLPLKSRRQAVSLGQTRREVSIVFGVPTSKFVAVMFGKPVAATIVIVVVVFVSIPVPPMSVAMILAAILAVLIFICKSCVSWNHKEPKNDDGKPFTIFQEFPPR